MNLPPYCLPIVNTDFSAALQLIRTEQQRFQYFELWVDYLQPLPQIAEILALAKEYGSRLIFVFRRLELAATQMDPKLRGELREALDVEPVWIDFDISTQAGEINLSPNARAKKLISYHNYLLTPENAELSSIVEKIKSFKPQMLKIATYCNTPVDALRLLALRIGLNAANFESVVLGMGPEGQSTRIFGSIWGNALIFAPQELSAATAAGQLTYAAYERIFSELGVSFGR